MPGTRSNLDTWLAPPAAIKRKRAAAVVDEVHSDSEKENVGTTKKAKTQSKKTSEAAPKKNSAAKATPKKDASKAAPKKVNDAKGAKKLYNETIKAVDKKVDDIDKRVKKMNPNGYAITTATYASFAAKHIPSTDKLANVGSVLAFNLLLSLADASHTDCDATPKMCGTPCDASGTVFRKLDDTLLPLIDSRAAEGLPLKHADALPEVPHRWTRKDADVGPFKTGYPNKQQRNQMYSQKLDWEKERRQARRDRREAVEDWVTVALSDFKEERAYLDQYGVEGYLTKSIDKLESLRTGS